jgi:hypothetical protein
MANQAVSRRQFQELQNLLQRFLSQESGSMIVPQITRNVTILWTIETGIQHVSSIVGLCKIKSKIAG